MNKEKAFISAVIYVHNDSGTAAGFVETVYRKFIELFERFEIIVADDHSTDQTVETLRQISRDFSKPLTIIHMSSFQGKEAAMNAGIDMAIGDYIYQMESTQDQFDAELLGKAFEAMRGKYDIMSVAPRDTALSGRIFYQLFNASSGGSAQIGTECFSIVTRRAVNRVHAISEYLPYRKSAFAASGLPYQRMCSDSVRAHERNTSFSTGVESLLLYTRLGYRFSAVITGVMLLLAVAELIYTIVIFCMGIPIEGWTTLALFITFGFAGVFLIMSIVIRYLSLLLEIIFRRQRYLVSDVEIIQK